MTGRAAGGERKEKGLEGKKEVISTGFQRGKEE